MPKKKEEALEKQVENEIQMEESGGQKKEGDANANESVTPHPSAALTPSPQGEGSSEGYDEVTSSVQGEEKEDVTEAKETTQGEAEEYVDYCLPFMPGKEPGDSQTVTINGKNYQVKYGVPVKVPLGVKEVLDEMVAQQRRTREKIERLTKEEKCIAKFE